MRALKSSRGQQKWSLSKIDLYSATNQRYARSSKAAAYAMCHSRILFLRHAHPAHRDCVLPKSLSFAHNKQVSKYTHIDKI